ncbi:bifunctional SulP family inorganic anion transporter/carbonic anhydrase [Legionella sp. W05-934-2]|jgi:carbonic anhydrase|uniref:bifunctional SulP family inorganic anion transporter/carbonic anhydrase n=1 Tax=Legionella sp. W05-934-2 TaxID=1198649 RepID=UPI0034618662
MHKISALPVGQQRTFRMHDVKFDVVSSIVVFLVAIPLCLGIALASGAPLFSGIISGIIGGIVVGIISGSHVSVSGPAAGMAAVVLTAIAQLGDFQTFLLAVVFAGFIQVLIGILRAGFVAEYIPSNVVQGLLCAIGILLIIKQLPLAFSHPLEVASLKSVLKEAADGISFTSLQHIVSHLSFGAIVISVASMSILLFFDFTKNKILKAIPSPIIVVLAAIFLNGFFGQYFESLVQDQLQLVNIPQYNGYSDLISQLQFPNWSALGNAKIYFYALVIAIVASLETLLNIKAGEKLDPRKRHSSKDRELVAQGIGNISAGLIGGLPITSVIVRTSVNIDSGAHSKLSTILHGTFLLAAVLLIPRWLNKIPLAALAAILIHTGYKLSKPAIYKAIYQQGLDRFIPFIATIVGIIIFNLLAGIIIGLAISFFYILKSSSQARLNIIKETYPTGIIYRLMLPQQVTFLNKASFYAELDTLPSNSQLIIDARYTQYMDKEIIELLTDFQANEAKEKNIAINLTGFKEVYDVQDQINFIDVTTYDVQANLTPAQVLKVLKEGNYRFINDIRIHRNPKMEVTHTSKTQHPIAVILGCIDSRVPVETIFDMTFGDLFCVRVAGNVISSDVLASIEFACGVAGAKLVVVLGHTRCGAIMSACDNVKTGHITQLLEKIKPSVKAATSMDESRDSSNDSFVQQVTELNIANTLWQIYSQSDILKDKINQDEIAIVGANYDVRTGKVSFKDYSPEVEVLLKKDTDQQLQKKLQEIVQPNALLSGN